MFFFSILLKLTQAQLVYGIVVPSAFGDSISPCEVECGHQFQPLLYLIWLLYLQFMWYHAYDWLLS